MRKLFNPLVLTLFFLASCGSSPDSDWFKGLERKETLPDVNFSTKLYIGNNLDGESAESIGSAIGLSAAKTQALAAAIGEHEREMKKIDGSDYAPYLVGILYQNENERYRNSIVEAIGHDDYLKWFDYERAAMDRKLKAAYNLDNEQLAQFKNIIKQGDIEVQGVLRRWIPLEQKQIEVPLIIEKRDEALKQLVGPDARWEEILGRSKEVKY